MKHNVGQIIYLLDSKRNAVLPARVFEQVIKKTIDGEEEFFYVGIPGHEDLLNLSEFEGLVFEDSREVKNHLFETLKLNIENLVDKASKDATSLWGEEIKVPKKRRGRRKKNPDVDKEDNQESGTLIDLGDGLVGRLKE
jgi:hypothetical protein